MYPSSNIFLEHSYPSQFMNKLLFGTVMTVHVRSGPPYNVVSPVLTGDMQTFGICHTIPYVMGLSSTLYSRMLRTGSIFVHPPKNWFLVFSTVLPR